MKPSSERQIEHGGAEPSVSWAPSYAGTDTGRRINGCPQLLTPRSHDWAPSELDLAAPQVLPRRSLLGVLHVMFSRSAGKPLNPVPQSFLRDPPEPNEKPPAPNGMPTAPTYSSFPAFYLPGKHEKHIARGFEARYPAKVMVDHDVSAVDWDRFLVNLRVAGALRSHDHLLANLAPAPLFLVHAGAGNYWITRGIMSALQKRYIPDVLALVELYQYRFFGPRRLDVFVACKTERISGYFPGDESYLESLPVEMGYPIDSSSDDGSSSESSDSSDEQRRRIDRRRRKQIQAQRRQSRPASYKNLRGADRAAALEHRRDVEQSWSQVLARRKAAIAEEQALGFNTRKHGKYRIVVQPLTEEPPSPSAECLQRMAVQEQRWSSPGILGGWQCGGLRSSPQSLANISRRNS